MAGCAVGVLLTSLSRISPKIQGKKQGKNCLGTGTCLWQCAGPQFPAGLLFLYGMFLCGTGLRSAGRERVLPGCWQPARPAVSNNIRGALPIRETGQPDAGQGIHALLPRHRTRSCPGNNGVAPGEQDGTGKTGSPDRRRDLPDLIRRTDPGFQGTGTSGGSRPIPGLRAGPERATSREGFFLPLAMPDLPTIFSAPVSRKFRRDPSGGFPARFGRAISFRAQGPFRFR